MGKSPHPDLKSDGEPEEEPIVGIKRRRGSGGRKGKSRDVNLPVALDDATKEYKIYDYLLKGYSYRDIAIKLGMSEPGVSNAISRAMVDMTERVAAKREMVATLSIERLEWLWSVGAKKLEESMKDGNEFDHRMYEALKGVNKQQWEMRNDAKQSGITINNNMYNQTLSTSSPLYQQAMLANQHPDVLEAEQAAGNIVFDPEIERLESIISDVESS